MTSQTTPDLPEQGTKRDKTRMEWIAEQMVENGMVTQAREVLAMDRELRKAQSENEHFTKSGIIEIAVRNPSVSDWMKHWESRALAAESRLAAVEKALKELRLVVGYFWNDEHPRIGDLDAACEKADAAIGGEG